MEGHSLRKLTFIMRVLLRLGCVVEVRKVRILSDDARDTQQHRR